MRTAAPRATSRSTMPGLLAGVLAVSSAAVLIRLAEAPPLTVAAYRLTLAALALVPAAALLYRGRMPALAPRDAALLALSAAFLAVHFAAWISSLSYTSVASSVFLVTTSPVFVVAASWAVLKERPTLAAVAGIAITMAGGAVLAGGDLALGDEHLLGDGLALLGAVAAAGYWLVGRAVRPRLPVLPYVAAVYGGAAALLLAAALAAGAPLTGYPPSTYGWLVLVALVPQVVGHSLLNWALARLSATSVSMAVRAEPVVATALAALVLGEAAPWSSLLGGAVILAGVGLALRADAR